MTRRPGVSLTELIVALGIFSVLMATTLGFYHQQGRAFTSGNERMTLMQNLRYGVNALEQHLRTAGVGVVAKQPVIVYASDRVFSFNANYASPMSDDLFAVYHDPELPENMASAAKPTVKFTLPLTAFAYPDSAYSDGGGNSPAETITFFFAPDNSTPRLDDHVLYRKVNNAAPEIIARNLVQADGPFFTYYTVREDGGTPVGEVPATYFPRGHTVPIHGSPGDTGIVAAVDSIRAVRVTYAATNGLQDEREVRRAITRLIRLPNAGVATQRTCGNKPLLETNLSAFPMQPSGGTPGHILLSWNRATDEYTGEMDVMRYVIWRRRTSETAFGAPLVSIAPGSTTYTYQDFTAIDNAGYVYALAAQDCTPQYSAVSVSGNTQW